MTSSMAALLFFTLAAPGSAAYSSFLPAHSAVPVLSLYISSAADLCGAVQAGHFPTRAQTTWLGAYNVQGPSAAPAVFFVVPGEAFQNYAQSVEGAPNERLLASKFVTDTHAKPRHVRHATAGTLRFEAFDAAAHGPLRGEAILSYPGEAADILPFEATYCAALGGG